MLLVKGLEMEKVAIKNFTVFPGTLDIAAYITPGYFKSASSVFSITRIRCRGGAVLRNELAFA